MLYYCVSILHAPVPELCNVQQEWLCLMSQLLNLLTTDLYICSFASKGCKGQPNENGSDAKMYKGWMKSIGNTYHSAYKQVRVLPSYASLQQKEATKWRLEMVKSIGTALKSKVWWPLISGEWWHLSFPVICLTVEGKLWRKPQPGKLTRPGINPGPARWEGMTLPCDHCGGRHVQDGLVSRIILCNWCKPKGSS